MSRATRWTPDDVLPHRGWSSVGVLGDSPWSAVALETPAKRAPGPEQAVEEILAELDRGARLPPDRRPTELDWRQRSGDQAPRDGATRSILGASLLDAGVEFAEGDAMVTEVSLSTVELSS